MAQKKFWLSYESAAKGTLISLTKVLDNLQFNEQGLLPVIAQDYQSKDVLMMAWMNRAALEESLVTGQVCYWSRSRQQFWRKGEQSGNRQYLQEMRIDCDGDTLLLLVSQQGGACHTQRRTCFYYTASKEVVVVNESVPKIYQDEKND